MTERSPPGESDPARPPAPPQRPEAPPARPSGPQRRPGIRLGPFYFVPQLGAAPGRDPWAHRKGEPRPFALLWATYLMVGTLLTVFAVRSVSTPTTAQFVYACRAMLILVFAGVCVLWPMVRLSQRFPPRRARMIVIDALVLLAPAQAVIWPMPLLAHWGWSVNAAITIVLVGWTTITGALLAFAMRNESTWARSGWTLLFVALVSAGPALLWALASTGAVAPTSSLAWLSPFTTLHRLTDAPSGVSPAMDAREWLLSCAPLACGLGLCLAWHAFAALVPGGRLAPRSTLQ